MVAIKTVRESNALVAELPAHQVAVFLGATSGIGRGALIHFATHAVQPKIYIVARRASAISDLIAELRTKNPEANYEVIEKDVSLIRECSKGRYDCRLAEESQDAY